MGMGFAPTWLRQVTPPPVLHKITLTTAGLQRHINLPRVADLSCRHSHRPSFITLGL